MGGIYYPFFLYINLNSNGGTSHDMKTTLDIPTIVISASECRAGCLATISEPMPMNIISAEIMMLLLNEVSSFFR